jgi:hypothetical protein
MDQSVYDAGSQGLASERVTQARDVMQQIAQQVQGVKDGLDPAVFDGQAARAFHQLMERWLTALTVKVEDGRPGLIVGLTDIAEKLKANDVAYTNSEGEQVGVMDKIAADLSSALSGR